MSGALSEEREAKNPSGTALPVYSLSPTLSDCILEVASDFDVFTNLKRARGLDSRILWRSLSLLSQACFVASFSALLTEDLAAVTARLASLS